MLEGLITLALNCISEAMRSPMLRIYPCWTSFHPADLKGSDKRLTIDSRLVRSPVFYFCYYIPSCMYAREFYAREN